MSIRYWWRLEGIRGVTRFHRVAPRSSCYLNTFTSGLATSQYLLLPFGVCHKAAFERCSVDRKYSVSVVLTSTYYIFLYGCVLVVRQLGVRPRRVSLAIFLITYADRESIIHDRYRFWVDFVKSLYLRVATRCVCCVCLCLVINRIALRRKCANKVVCCVCGSSSDDDYDDVLVQDDGRIQWSSWRYYIETLDLCCTYVFTYLAV